MAAVASNAASLANKLLLKGVIPSSTAITFFGAGRTNSSDDF